RIADALDEEIHAVAGVEAGVFLARKVPNVSQFAFDIGGGGGRTVAHIEIRLRQVVEVGHVGAVGGCYGTGWDVCKVGRKWQALVVVIFSADAVDTIVGVGDSLVLCIAAFDEVGSVVIREVHHAPVRI